MQKNPYVKTENTLKNLKDFKAVSRESKKKKRKTVENLFPFYENSANLIIKK